MNLLNKIWQHIKSKNGYSLVELVAALVLSGLMLPTVVDIFGTTAANSFDAEFMSIANFLAVEQMEIILADKAGSGAGYGYSAITSAKYANVNPPAPFNGFTRTVTITDFNINNNPSYPAKQIVVRVHHPTIPDVVLTAFITDHSGL
ncbi:MAG: type II secretion system protein [Calditrichaeota bacterium]|nr:type II secretion system protein [Calditrichota bacterium]